jgi:hypothetical protein
VLTSAGTESPAATCRFPAASPYTPVSPPPSGPSVTRHHRGFTVFTRPAFPLPVTPGWDGSPWASPPSFTPRRCQRRMSRWGQALEHWPGSTSSTSVDPPLPRIHSLRAPSCRTPVSLAGPGPSDGADPSRRCRGCLPPSPAPPGSGCPQLHQTAATARRRSPFISARSHGASWRTAS